MLRGFLHTISRRRSWSTFCSANPIWRGCLSVLSDRLRRTGGHGAGQDDVNSRNGAFHAFLKEAYGGLQRALSGSVCVGRGFVHGVAVVKRGNSQIWLAIVALTLSMFCIVTATTSVASDGSYVLNIGDTVEFDLLQEEDPPAQYTIGNQGTISLPLIGAVEVTGLTIGEAREKITET